MSEYTSTTKSSHLIAMEPARAEEMQQKVDLRAEGQTVGRHPGPANGHVASAKSTPEGLPSVRREDAGTLAGLPRLTEAEAAPCLFLLELPTNSLGKLSPAASRA